MHEWLIKHEKLISIYTNIFTIIGAIAVPVILFFWTRNSEKNKEAREQVRIQKKEDRRLDKIQEEEDRKIKEYKDIVVKFISATIESMRCKDSSNSNNTTQDTYSEYNLQYFFHNINKGIKDIKQLLIHLKIIEYNPEACIGSEYHVLLSYPNINCSNHVFICHTSDSKRVYGLKRPDFIEYLESLISQISNDDCNKYHNLIKEYIKRN